MTEYWEKGATTILTEADYHASLRKYSEKRMDAGTLPAKYWKIEVLDEDCQEWRDADESDGLDVDNSFADYCLAESEARRIVRRCAHNFQSRVSESDAD